MTLAGTHGHPAKSHAVEQQDVVANFRRLADDHSHAVVDEEALTDDCGWVDLDAGEVSGGLGQSASGEAVPFVPQLVSGAVRPQGVDAWIEKCYLHVGTGSRIAFTRRSQVLACQFQKGPFGVVHGVLL